jgi:hypothetical protein
MSDDGRNASADIAEGATAPESLRQKDRDAFWAFWKAGITARTTGAAHPPPTG